MMQHHIAHLLAELFTSEFHRRTYHPIANHTRFFLPGNTISSHFAGIVPHLGAHKAKVGIINRIARPQACTSAYNNKEQL